MDIPKYSAFWVSCLGVLGIHAGISMLRAYLYSLQFHTPALEYYQVLTADVWVLMVGLALLGSGISHAVNSYDLFFYKRYQQFLRLEFDTRLGMHSPR